MELNENNRPLTEVPANEMPETSVQPVADASQARYPQRKSKEEVIERLKEIIADNCNADKQEIDLLKQTFYKLHKAEQDAAQKILSITEEKPRHSFRNRIHWKANSKVSWVPSRRNVMN